MDGRVATALLTLLLPAILIGVTIAYFGSNPVSILVLLTIVIIGSLYMLSYPESF